MLHNLQQWDYWLLIQINTVWVSPWADAFFGFVTNFHKQYYWSLPLLGVTLVLLIYMDWKTTFALIVTLILAIALSDMFSYRVIKKNVQRPRPSENIELVGQIRVIGTAHGTSFPSNHASNCFAAAFVLGWFFRRRSHYFYALAGLVAYSRIYLGVHYPSDVYVGAFLGLIVGLICTQIFAPWILRFILRGKFRAES